MIDIAAPPARVWTIMKDVERWHEWTASVTSIRLLDPAPLRVGSRALVKQPTLLPAEMRVTAIEDNAGFTWVSKSLGVVATGLHTIVPTAKGSRVTLSLTFAGPLSGVVAFFFGKLTQRYVQMEAEGLKRRSEDRTAVEHSRPEGGQFL